MTEAILVTPRVVSDVTRNMPGPARLAFHYASRLHRGRLYATLPDGRRFLFQGTADGPEAELIVHDLGFARRFINGGDVGIAEGYLHGEWDTPDLTAFLYLFSVNHEMIQSLLGDKPLYRLWQLFRHWLNRNTKRQAKRNIQAHYDLGNAFYSRWLDPTMTYSSALYEPGTKDLSDAQHAKYRALAQAICLGQDARVLEIGCGWGGFAEYAAKHHGARVTGLTISPAQLDYAQKRIFEAGLAERVAFKLQDYRDERGTYDRIASIEMIEAVGEKYWPTYFQQVRDRLAPGGMAGIQAITIQDRFFQAYRREMDFIRRYVFPGGMLPAPSIMKAMGEKHGMPVVGERIFGLDYARTLAEWRDRFVDAWPDLKGIGFDERFRRLWEYYLCYCEAGFRSGNIDVRQMVFARVS